MSTRPHEGTSQKQHGGDFPPGPTGIESFDLAGGLTASREELLFERLVAEIASRFAGIDPNRVDDVIVDGLHRIVDTLGLDRGVVWRRSRGEMNLSLIHI